MKKIILSVVACVIGSSQMALARKCQTQDWNQLIEGLEKFQKTATQVDLISVNTALKIAKNERTPPCNVESGFAGQYYTIGTKALGAKINFVGTKVESIHISMDNKPNGPY